MLKGIAAEDGCRAGGVAKSALDLFCKSEGAPKSNKQKSALVPNCLEKRGTRIEAPARTMKADAGGQPTDIQSFY